MKPFAFALAALPFILAAALPVVAEDASGTPKRGKVMLALDQDGIADTFSFDELAIGESRQIEGKNGKLVTLTRSVDALTIEADGKTTRITPSGSDGALTRIKLVRNGTDNDGEARRLMILGGSSLDITDDLMVLDGTLDGLDLDLDIQEALSRARVALDSVDRTILVKSLDAARADLDNIDIDIDSIIADAKANGGKKVVVIRRKSEEQDGTN